MQHFTNYWIFCCLLFVFFNVSAQDDEEEESECTSKLKKVIESYANGEIDKKENINALNQCMNQFTKLEKAEAYKYLTLIYLYRNENVNAKNNMIEFLRLKLKKFPDYNPRQEIPEKRIPEFIELFNKLSHWADYYFGIKMGGNFSTVFVSRNFSVDNTTAQRWAYKSALGYQIGTFFELPLGKNERKLSLLSEANLVSKSYQFSDKLLDFANISFKEAQTWLEVPVLMQYKFNKNTIQPYLAGGIALNLLFVANGEITRTDDLGNGGERRVPQSTVNLTQEKLRKFLNYGLAFGGGFRFRNFAKSGGDLMIEGRLNFPLNNLVREENRYANENLLFDYGYVDSDFKIGSIMFTLGYAFPRYKPKQITNFGRTNTSFGN